MVFAAIGAASALAGAGAAVYGATTANANAAAARRQNAAAMDVQRRQMELSREQQEASMAPTRNARGDVSKYIPGVGWVEEPSDLTRTLIGRSDNEEALRLAHDLPRQRMQREQLFKQQQVERGLANAMLARQSVGTRSLADVEADALRMGAAQAVAGNQQQNRDAVITALRQGTGAQELIARNDKDSAANLRIALEEARAGAPRMYADAESARLNDSQNRYAQMAARAFAVDNMPFQPNTLADTLMSQGMANRRNSTYGMGLAGNIQAPKFAAEDDQTAARLGIAMQNIGKFAESPYAKTIGGWFGSGSSTTPPAQPRTTYQPQAPYNPSSGVW